MSRYSGPGDYSGGSTPRQKVRDLKYAEAVERNRETPHHKRRSTRRNQALLIREGKGAPSLDTAAPRTTR
jgi:hypothetical protein